MKDSAVLMFSQKIVVDPETQIVILPGIFNRTLGSGLPLLNILLWHWALGKQRL